MTGTTLFYPKVSVYSHISISLLLTHVDQIGYTTPDIVTYNLISGLLEIAFQRSEYEEIIYETLWNYGRCIIDLIDTSSSK
jgi:hypothetical protein